MPFSEKHHPEKLLQRLLVLIIIINENLNVTLDKEKLDSRTHPSGYFSQLRGISQSLRAGDCRAGACFDPQIIFIGPLTRHVSKLNLVSGDFIEWDVCLCPKFNPACRRGCDFTNDDQKLLQRNTALVISAQVGWSYLRNICSLFLIRTSVFLRRSFIEGLLCPWLYTKDFRQLSRIVPTTHLTVSIVLFSKSQMRN